MIKYFVGVLPVVMLVYLFSCVGYNWTHQNKRGAIGVAILALAAFSLSMYVLFIGNYEI